MGEVLAVLAVTLLLVSVSVGMYVRDSAGEERPLETRVSDPRTRTVVYAIPGGADPAVLRLALERAGFSSQINGVGTARRLLVACMTTERAALRGVLEAAHANAAAGDVLKRGHVVFEDER